MDPTEFTLASERAGTFGRGGPGLYVPPLEAPPCGKAETKPVERVVLLATPAVVPAASVGETADMATVFENGTTNLSRTLRRARH